MGSGASTAHTVCTRRNIFRVDAGKEFWNDDSLDANLKRATESFKRSKDNDGEFVEDSSMHLDQAIQYYTIALAKAPGPKWQSKPILTLQLAKAHANRAISSLLSPSEANEKLAAEHIGAAVARFREYSSQAAEVEDANASAKLSAVVADLVDRMSLVPSLSHRILLARAIAFNERDAASASYAGPHVVHARICLKRAQWLFQQAMKILDDDMDLAKPLAELKRLTQVDKAEWRSISKEDSVFPALRGWLACRQTIDESKDSLTQTAYHLRYSASEDSGQGGDLGIKSLREEHKSLAEQVRFCWHRSRVLLQLAGCAEMLHKVSLGSEELNIEGLFDLDDTLRDVRKQAADSRALGRNTEAFDVLDGNSTDVELECVCLHYLAVTLGCLGLKAQERDMHKQVVIQGLSLDPSVTDYSNPTAVLRQRAWFMNSQAFMMKAQQDDAAVADRTRRMALEAIRSPLDAIKRANTDEKSFLRYLYANHPPKNGGTIHAAVSEEGDIPKVAFMRMLRDYNVDKLPVDTEEREKLLYEEITKMFTNHYELLYKAGGPPENPCPCP